MRKISMIFLCCCVFLLAAMPVAASGIFSYVPSEYFFMLHTPNGARILEDAEKLARSFGVHPFRREQTKELVDAMRQYGFDTAGEMSAIILNDPQDMQTNKPPLFVVLAQVKDRALLQKAVVITPDGDLIIPTVQTAPPSSRPIYVQYAGNYIAMTTDKESLQQYRQMLQAGKTELLPQTQTALLANDVTMVMNFKKVWPLVSAKVDEGLAASNKTGGAAAMPALDPMAKLWIDETDTALLGYKNGEADISLNMLMTVKPGGFAANVISRYQDSATSGFAGLPSGKWLTVGQGAGDRQVREAYRDFTGKDYQPVLPPKDKLDTLSPTLSEWITQSNKLTSLLGDQRFAWYAAAAKSPADPAAKLATEVLQGIYIFETTDAQQVSSELSRAIKAMVAATRRDKDIPWKVAEKNAKVDIDGLKVSRINLTFRDKDKSKTHDGRRKTVQVEDILKQIFGSETVSLYLLPYNQQTLVLGIGQAEPLLGLTVAALKTGSGTLANDPRLSQVTERLTGTNLSLVAISSGRIVDAVSGNGMGMFETLLSPPITISTSVDGETVLLQASLPQALIKMLLNNIFATAKPPTT